jgi:hypothetical protein
MKTSFSTEQIIELARSTDPAAELIVMIDRLACQVIELSAEVKLLKELPARVKTLEDRQQAPAAKIRVV